MCTAILFKSKDSYFGRNLDLERGYREQVVITPRRYGFRLRRTATLSAHYAMIGMAAVAEDFPLYFEATNEKGLSMAGLNFPGNAFYPEPDREKTNIAPFEFIPWVLSQCADIGEAKALLENTALAHINFSDGLPASPLHWMISDRHGSIVVESIRDGLKIWDNPFDVLTNNPTFDYHRVNLSNYMGLNDGPAATAYRRELPLENYSLGMGALGLPGDFSSASRFVRAFFVKEHSQCGADEASSVNQFFHILGAVAMPKGCVWTRNGYEYTRYSSCCNADQGIYYYTTYGNPAVRSVALRSVDLDSASLHTYPVTDME